MPFSLHNLPGAGPRPGPRQTIALLAGLMALNAFAIDAMIPALPAIGSDLYETEFNEVRDYGSKTSAVRTMEQTNLALFVNDIPVIPIQAALRDLVDRRDLDISASARLFAAVDMSIADSIIAIWDGKLVYGWWRPITAIRLANMAFSFFMSVSPPRRCPSRGRERARPSTRRCGCGRA